MQTAVGQAKYNMGPLQLVSGDQHAASNGAVTTSESHTTTLNVENPVVWLLFIGAVTFGLVAFSTSVRVGKFAASASAG